MDWPVSFYMDLVICGAFSSEWETLSENLYPQDDLNDSDECSLETLVGLMHTYENEVQMYCASFLLPTQVNYCGYVHLDYVCVCIPQLRWKVMAPFRGDANCLD